MRPVRMPIPIPDDDAAAAATLDDVAEEVTQAWLAIGEGNRSWLHHSSAPSVQWLATALDWMWRFRRAENAAEVELAERAARAAGQRGRKAVMLTEPQIRALVEACDAFDTDLTVAGRARDRAVFERAREALVARLPPPTPRPRRRRR